MPIIPKLNHSKLDSESSVDRFLNHLDYDTLTGLQRRLSPVEYAIHVICSRNQESFVNDGSVSSSAETEPVDNRNPQNEPAPTSEMEPIIDDETLPQTAPTCVIAKHKEEDPEKLRPYLAYLPR